MKNKLVNILSTTLAIYSLALISPTFSISDKEKCNCSSYSFSIDEALPRFVLRPSLDGLYSHSMACEWHVQFDSKNDSLMLEIILDLEMNPNDMLIIKVCNSQNVIYNSSSLYDQYSRFYTQEQNLCISFNSSKQTRVFYWNIIFSRMLAPSFYEVSMLCCN